MCWFTQPVAHELALPCCLKFENLTWPKPNKINHVFLSILMLCVDNTPSRIVCVRFHSSIITHPAHIFHFYNFPSISLYLPLPFPNSLLFHSCFPADILFIIPYTLHLFQTLNSPFSSSELLFCLKFLSITNAFWVERAGVRGCPYEALLVPAQSPGICWLMSNPTRALWSFLTSLHPLCTHTHSSQSFVSTQKYSVSASTWVLVVIGQFYGSHIWHYMPSTPQRYAASSMFYRKQKIQSITQVSVIAFITSGSPETAAGCSTMDHHDK